MAPSSIDDANKHLAAVQLYQNWRRVKEEREKWIFRPLQYLPKEAFEEITIPAPFSAGNPVTKIFRGEDIEKGTPTDAYFKRYRDNGEKARQARIFIDHQLRVLMQLSRGKFGPVSYAFAATVLRDHIHRFEDSEEEHYGDTDRWHILVNRESMHVRLYPELVSQMELHIRSAANVYNPDPGTPLEPDPFLIMTDEAYYKQWFGPEYVDGPSKDVNLLVKNLAILGKSVQAAWETIERDDPKLVGAIPSRPPSPIGVSAAAAPPPNPPASFPSSNPSTQITTHPLRFSTHKDNNLRLPRQPLRQIKPSPPSRSSSASSREDEAEKKNFWDQEKSLGRVKLTGRQGKMYRMGWVG